jgi:hypothetical protein
METQPPQDRRMDGVVEDLIAHVENNLMHLPMRAKEFLLSQESVDYLRITLEEELQFLKTLPKDMAIRELIENHMQNTRLRSQEYDKYEFTEERYIELYGNGQEEPVY